MKNLTTVITLLLLCVASVFAQAPEKFTYQAVVRNASNALVANAQVGVRVNILQGSATGNAVYSESHVVTTNANGLVTVNIGGGSVLHGSFVGINWADGPYFLKTDIDPNGGNDYSITSTQQLLSVPYALYATEAANGFSGDYNDLVNVPQIPQIPADISAFNNDAGYITMDSVPAIPTNVSAFTNDAGYLTSFSETDPQFNAWDKDYDDLINKPVIPTVPTNVSAFTNDAGYLTSFTEQQVLSISNDTLFLTGGSFVKLPAGFDGDYNSLTNKPVIPTVPTNVSAFSNDAGYITGYTETDPQFNAWDKDYNDLTNKPVIPTIPTNVSAFTNDAGYLTEYTEQQILTISNDTIFLSGGSFVKLPAVTGFSGDYNDLTNKPTIPIVPTNVSAFTNDAGYITDYTEIDPMFNAWDKDYNDLINTPTIPTVPENVSAFANDAGYLTSFTEQQILTISNDTIFLTGGSFVKLPAGFSGDYNDLTNKPEIPEIPDLPDSVSAFTNDAGYITMADIQAFLDELNNTIDSLRDRIEDLENGVEPSAPDMLNMQHIISVSLKTDQFGNETTWEIKDLFNDTILASGGPYSTLTDPGTTIQDISDIIVDGAGCYVFTIYDSYGDGIDIGYGSGSYSVSYDGVVMGSGGSSFSQESVFLNPNSNYCDHSPKLSLVSLDVALNMILNTTFQVKGNVKNNGLDTIVAFKVKYRVDGGEWMSDCSVSCNIPYQGTCSFTHDEPFFFSTAGQHSLEVVVFDPNGVADGVMDNSISIEVVVIELPEGDAQPCSGSPTVTDIDGNIYNTVQIGGQCWMKENLRTTRYANGVSIPIGEVSSLTSPYYYDDNGSSMPLEQRGYLYNWAAVMNGAMSSSSNPSNVQGVCPTSWHVPSDSEWSQLEDYLSNQNVYLCDNSTSFIAKALSATSEWMPSTVNCEVGNNQGSNNYTGFSAFPVGGFYGNYNLGANEHTTFWSSTESSIDNVWYRLIAYDSYVVSRGSYGSKNHGFSVRCILDDTTAAIIPDTNTSASVTSTFPCAVASSHSAQTGSDYQSNGHNGANYGLETVNADGTINSVTDYDGNEYPVVQIGSQCWLAENMRCTHSPSTGSYIVNNQFTSGTSVAYTWTGKMSRWYNNDSITYAPKHYGLLYNWNAAVDTFNTDYGELSINESPDNVVGVTFNGNRQGICPIGWHVPSDEEWTTMETEVNGSDVSDGTNYECRGSYAGKLAGGDNWAASLEDMYSEANSPNDYNYIQRNSTGFNALPAGVFYDDFYFTDGYYTSFWSSSKDIGPYTRTMSFYTTCVERGVSGDAEGYSVRCIRDGAVTLPIVTTFVVESVTESSAILKASVSNPDGLAITNQGFEWGLPWSDNYTQEICLGINDTFTINLSNLAENNYYTYRAFVTCGGIKVYGEYMMLRTLCLLEPFTVVPVPCNVSSYHPAQTGSAYQGNGHNGVNHGLESVGQDGKINSVTDYDGNEYPVVQIGSQCWLAENLRCSHSPKTGRLIVDNHIESFSSKHAEWYTRKISMEDCLLEPFDSVACVTHHFGLLYNWCATMDTACPTNYVEVATELDNNNTIWYYTPSGNQQGICPIGWHVPSDTEWSEMESFVSGSDLSISTGYRGTHAGKLAGGNVWKSSTTSNAPGNYNDIRNSSGFSAVPAGSTWLTTFDGGGFAQFWSSSWSSSREAWSRCLCFGSSGVQRTYIDKNVGFSVRCLRDDEDNSITADAQPCSETPTVTDIDGNVYNTVQIGQQCWMKENLRTTKYANGSSIPAGSSASVTAPYYYDYCTSSIALEQRGYLYNWAAVMHGAVSSSSNPSNVQGVCPTGWHVPSDSEWAQLANYVGGKNQYSCNSDATFIAKTLSSAIGWDSSANTCAVGNNTSSNNLTEYSAMPAGCYDEIYGYACSGQCAYFRSATETSNGSAWEHFLYYNSALMQRNGGSKSGGKSVRCLRD